MDNVEVNDNADVLVDADGIAIVVPQVDPNAPKVEGTPVQVIGEENGDQESDTEVSVDSTASDVEVPTAEA